MGKLRFRFQALLDTAHQREKSTQQELMRADQTVKVGQRQLDSLVRVLHECEERIRENQHGAFDYQALREQLRAAGALRQRIFEQREVVRGSEQKANTVRNRLMRITCRRKSLERLRDKIAEEYRDGSQAHRTLSSPVPTTSRADILEARL